jgi:TusA-related sulfurtransferase
VLKLIATDRGSLADVPAWAESTGNELLERHEEGDTFVFFLRKGEEA